MFWTRVMFSVFQEVAHLVFSVSHLKVQEEKHHSEEMTLVGTRKETRVGVFFISRA